MVQPPLKVGLDTLTHPHTHTVLGPGDLNVVSGSKVLCAGLPLEDGGRERRVSDHISQRRKRAVSQKSSGLIHHAPLNPLSFHSATLALRFSIFCHLSGPPVADWVTLSQQEL